MKRLVIFACAACAALLLIIVLLSLRHLITFATVVHLCTSTIEAAAPQERETFLDASVVAFHRNPGGIEEIMLAETEFRIPSGYCLDKPRVRILIETTAGRELQDAAQMEGRNDPWNLRPGGLNHITFMLPANTVRWRMILTGREAGLRARWFQSLSLRYDWWARNDSGRLRSIWYWIGRRLPNNAGPKVQFESPWLPARLERTLELVPNHA